MTPFLLPSRGNWFALVLAVLCCQTSRAVELPDALQVLGRADAGTASQVEAQRAWQAVVAKGTVKDIPEILAAMKEVGPLAANWLRAAVDTIAEREHSKTGSLPKELLETFTLDMKQAPRARRIAYEWLVNVDATAPERLLPQMLDDPSLELRYDAIERLLGEVKDTSKLLTKYPEQYQVSKYQRALRSARDKSQIKICAEALKELGREPNLAEQMGFLSAWKVIGPFDNTDRAGFDKVFPPEQGIDLAGEYAGKHGPVKWKEVVAEQKAFDDLGKVDLNAALIEEKSVLAYALATFVVAEDLQVECRYETLEASKLWVNGKEIAAKNVYHSGGGFDLYIVPCQLKQGENQILIKVCQNEQTEPWTKPWDFRLRITDKLGGAEITHAVLRD